MEIVAQTAEQVAESVNEQLGLNAPVEQTVMIATQLRRAASLMCPTSPTSLIMAVDRVLAPLLSDSNRRQRCRDVLERLIEHGDLMEFDAMTLESTIQLGNQRLIYLSPPSFVSLNDARLLLLGVAPDDTDPLRENLQPSLVEHKRYLSTDGSPDVASELVHLGLHEIPYSVWTKQPRSELASAVVQFFDRLLDGEAPCGAIDDLRVFNTSVATRWYKDRWTEPAGLTGRFVARRPRKYGADLWCYIQLQGGVPQRLIDLPQGRSFERGCDQAWRLQCALDAHRGEPQQYRVTQAKARCRIDTQLPCPSWLVRRWECVGERAESSVFSFLFAPSELVQEIEVLETQLWMRSER